MLSLVLSLALLQEPKDQPKKPEASIVKISEASNQKLKDVIQKIKDLQSQIESGQKDAQNLMLQIVIETIKANPGFNEQDYDVVLDQGNYAFKLREKKTKEK